MTIVWRIGMIKGEYFRPLSWFTVLVYKHQSGKHGAYSRERGLRWIQRFGASETYKFIHITNNSSVPVHPRATFLRLVPSACFVRIVLIKSDYLGGCRVQAQLRLDGLQGTRLRQVSRG